MTLGGKKNSNTNAWNKYIKLCNIKRSHTMYDHSNQQWGMLSSSQVTPKCLIQISKSIISRQLYSLKPHLIVRAMHIIQIYYLERFTLYYFKFKFSS